jgi:Phage integrase family
MENLRLREAAPTSVNVTVGKRSREYLTDREVERLIEAAKENRSGHRDATAILVAYRHGLRASELVALRWDGCGLVLEARAARSAIAWKPRFENGVPRSLTNTNGLASRSRWSHKSSCPAGIIVSLLALALASRSGVAQPRDFHGALASRRVPAISPRRLNGARPLVAGLAQVAGFDRS